MHHLYDYMYTLGFELKTIVVKGTDCTGTCKFNYYTITTMWSSQYWKCEDMHINDSGFKQFSLINIFQ